MATEIWKSVIGFEDHYSVSDKGRVRRDEGGKGAVAGKILKGSPGNNGYPRVLLRVGGEKTYADVHVLETRAFKGECPVGFEVHHIDEDKTNNALPNLEYREKYQHGSLHKAGEVHPNAKLTNDDVRVIRELYAVGVSQRALAARFGVCQSWVSNVVLRKNWKHVA